MRLKDKTLQLLLNATRRECEEFDAELCRTVIGECCASDASPLTSASPTGSSPSVNR
jgi:hypothetical protein